MRKELVGYILGALDDESQKDLESRLASNERLREDLLLLRRAIQPLDRGGQTQASERFMPPSDLASRTCEAVSEARQHRMEVVGSSEQSETADHRGIGIGIEVQRFNYLVPFAMLSGAVGAAACSASGIGTDLVGFVCGLGLSCFVGALAAAISEIRQLKGTNE